MNCLMETSRAARRLSKGRRGSSHAQQKAFASLDFTRGTEEVKSRFSSPVDYTQSILWVRGSLSRMVR
jgi:hypothetical protein